MGIVATGDGEFRVDSELIEGGVAVFSIKGDLDLVTAEQLREPLVAAVETDSNASVVIDLSDCSFIDSQGIAVLLQAYRTIAGDGDDDPADGDGGPADGDGNSPRLVVAAEHHPVIRTLELVGIDRWIPIVPDRAEALRRLNVAGSAPA
jgi:anti-sigma B factor antagonist